MLNLRRTSTGAEPCDRKFYLDSLRVALYCLKRFSLDLEEVDNHAFLASIDELLSKLAIDQPRQWGPALESCRNAALLQSKREKTYIREREEEFRNIVSVMAENLSGLAGENQDFHHRMERSVHCLDEAARLDDLRKMREVLSQQASVIRQELEERQQREEKMLRDMNQEIQRLNCDLSRAVDASLTDPLTGCANRQALEARVRERLERHVLGGPPFAILIWDVDNFKHINDTYGHPAGDSVLRALVKQSYKMTRASDLIARYGGEEFVIILENVNLSQAFRRAKQVVRSIAGIDLLLTVAGRVTRLQVTVSMGVALSREEDTMASFLERADRALYQAKRSGKNRAICED